MRNAIATNKSIIQSFKRSIHNRSISTLNDGALHAVAAHIDEPSDDSGIIVSPANFPNCAARTIMEQKYDHNSNANLVKKDSFVLWLTLLTTISMVSNEAIRVHVGELEELFLDLVREWRTEH